MSLNLNADLIAMIHAAVSEICEESDDEEELMAIKAVVLAMPKSSKPSPYFTHCAQEPPVPRKRKLRKLKEKVNVLEPSKYIVPSRFEDRSVIEYTCPDENVTFCHKTLAFDDKCICALHKRTDTTINSIVINQSDGAFISNADFKCKFHMLRSTADTVYQLIHENLTETESGLTHMEFLSVLWSLANNEDLGTIAQRFQVNSSDIPVNQRRLYDMMLKRRFEFERWPCREAALATNEGFSNAVGLSGVMGFVDCVHFLCDGQPYSGSYRNINDDPTVIYELACNHRGAFIYSSYFWWPGKMTVQEIQEDSPLSNMIFPSNLVLLGSRHYAARKSVVAQYSEFKKLTTRQLSFNERHRMAQDILHGAVLTLLSRFTCLQMLKVQCPWVVRKQFATCLLLHNICSDLNDDFQRDPNLHEETHFLPALFESRKDVEAELRETMTIEIA